MTMYFSKSAGGFLDSRVHKVIPKDAVVLSDAGYAELMAGWKQGKVIQVNSAGAPVLVAPGAKAA
jgi:hypothetical protein